jgi:hypothetical protein
MRLKNFSIIFLCCFISGVLNAQNENKKHHIGLQAGMTNGVGFSYKFIPRKFGFQLSFVSFYSRRQELIQSQGASLIYVLKEYSKLETFTYLGGAYGFSNRMSEEDENLDIARKYRDILSTGGGIGTNIYLGDSFEFSFQLGVTVLTIQNTQKVFPSGGLGFFYKF